MRRRRKKKKLNEEEEGKLRLQNLFTFNFTKSRADAIDKRDTFGQSLRLAQ